MRRFLLAFGFLSVAGSLIDAAITLLLVGFIAVGASPADLSVDDHVKEHLPFLYWARDVAEAVFADPFVLWLFALPALLFFPARLLVSAILGGWALKAARRMSSGVPA
ncbi:MAG: hypothetical protein ACK4NP_12265 [Parvularculaceae bacterium]